MTKSSEQALRDLLASPAPRPRVTLFVVDDEAVVCQVLERLLADLADEIRVFANGDSALEAILATPPAVVVVDKNLPDITGIELIRLGKQQAPTTEFVIITGYASLESAVTAIDLGAFSYIKKPFTDLEAVKSRVADAVARHGAVIENGLLRERLEDAYLALYHAKAEIELQNEIADERLRLREVRFREALETVLEPLDAIGSHVQGLAHYFADLLAGQGDRLDSMAELTRCDKAAELLTQIRNHAESLAADLEGNGGEKKGSAGSANN